MLKSSAIIILLALALTLETWGLGLEAGGPQATHTSLQAQVSSLPQQRVTYTPIPPTATPDLTPVPTPDAYPYPAPVRHQETLQEAVAKLLEDLFGSR